MNIRLLALSLPLLAAAGCSQVPLAAYSNRGEPESLLDVSSEVVTVDLTSPDSIDEISNWMETDQPTRAEVHCVEGDPLCQQAADVFNVYSLEYQDMPAEAGNSQVYLVYERILARDCENRYIDNSINPYNFNHPTFGCSVAANSVQMVSDKRQFVSPALLDFHDAAKLVQAYNGYVNPQLQQQNAASQPPAPTIAQQTGELDQ